MTMNLQDRITLTEAAIEGIDGTIAALNQKLSSLQVNLSITASDPDQIAEQAIAIAQRRAENATAVAGITAAIDELQDKRKGQESLLATLKAEQDAIDRAQAIARAQAAIEAAATTFDKARAGLESAMWELKRVAAENEKSFQSAQSPRGEWGPRSLLAWSSDGLPTLEKMEVDGLTTYAINSRSIGLFTAEIEAAAMQQRMMEFEKAAARQAAINELLGRA